MARKTTKATRSTKTTKKSTSAFTFKLSWKGLAGVTVVTICLFLWMFMLGVWAGQTVLLPPGGEMNKTAASPVKIEPLPLAEPLPEAQKRGPQVTVRKPVVKQGVSKENSDIVTILPAGKKVEVK